MTRQKLPREIDYFYIAECTNDKDVYCPYADIFACNGKEDHDKELQERENHDGQYKARC